MVQRMTSDLRTQTEILQTVFDHVPAMINVVDADGRIVLVNPQWERTLGWTLAELQEIGADIFTLTYPDPAYRRQVLDFLTAATGTWTDLSTRVRDGRVIETTWAVVLLSDGMRIGIGQDITHRKRAQKALRTFSRRLVEVQEAERRAVARELHDEVGQLLTGLGLMLETGAEQSAQALAQTLRQAQAIAKDLQTRVRTLSLDLRPTMLDDLGLLPTLLWHFERYTALTGVRVVFGQHGLGGRRFDPEVETAAYRIVQEALTNVARHAGTKEAVVWITAQGRDMRLSIEDEGRGFDARTALDTARGGGLQGMRERAQLLSGRFRAEASSGAGTRIVAELPLQPPPGA